MIWDMIRKKADPSGTDIFNYYFAQALEFKLRSFVLDECNMSAGSLAHILKEFDHQNRKADNTGCRDTLTTCKAIAGELMRNSKGRVHEREADKVWENVCRIYYAFGGSPVDGEDE